MLHEPWFVWMRFVCWKFWDYFLSGPVGSSTFLEKISRLTQSLEALFLSEDNKTPLREKHVFVTDLIDMVKEQHEKMGILHSNIRKPVLN